MIATRALTVLAMLAVATPVHAQPAEAEVLFREGKHMLATGDVAGACAKLDASEGLDAAVGTELNLADCLERNGQVASAWAMFAKAEQSAKRLEDRKRAAEARRRGAQLAPKLVYLTIAVADRRQIDGLVIERDGTAVERVLWNQRLLLDPGDYNVAASAPGHLPWSTTVSLRGESRTVEVPALATARIENPFPRDDRTEVVDDDAHEPARYTEAHERQPRRFGAASVAFAAIGIGAIGMGASFGYFSQELESRSDHVCTNAGCSDPQAVDQNQRARRDALIADGAFITGGASLAAAAVLWLIGHPSRHAERLTIAPLAHGAGLVIGGQL